MVLEDIRDGVEVAEVSLVVMAKAPVAGAVKTRLCGGYTAMEAASIHCAMLNCVLGRISGIAGNRRNMGLYLALDDVGHNSGDGLEIEYSDEWELIFQGEGDLGARMEHVWREVGGGRVIFMGGDSPDFPIDGLNSAVDVIMGVGNVADVVLGGSDDGGYWLVGGRKFYPQLLSGIDWGSERVYHQTLESALGLVVYEVESWYDVDRPGDLDELRVRLSDVCEEELKTLLSRVEKIYKG